MAVPTIAETQEDHQASVDAQTSTTVVFDSPPTASQLILITVFFDGTPGVVVAPTELTFTAIDSSLIASGDLHGAQWWAAGDGVTNSFTISWDDAEGCWCGSMLIDGADLASPVDVSAQTEEVGDAPQPSSHTSPSVTTTIPGCLGLRAMGLHSLATMAAPTNGQIGVLNSDSGVATDDDVTGGITWEPFTLAEAQGAEEFVSSTGRHSYALTTAIAPALHPAAITTGTVISGTAVAATPSEQFILLDAGGYGSTEQALSLTGAAVSISTGGVDADLTVASGSGRPTTASQVGYLGAGYVASDLTNPQTGIYTIVGSGGTYDFLDVSGKIRITGNNNLLRFGRVTAAASVDGDSGVIEITGSGNTIEDFEIMASADLTESTPRTLNGVWCNADSPFTLRRCYIAGASSGGVLVNTNGGTTTIEGCLAEERYALAFGAQANAVYSQQGGGALNITNCTFDWGIPSGYVPSDVPATVSQGQALWLQNDVDTPKPFTELIIKGTKAVSTSLTVGLSGVTSSTTRVVMCDNVFVSDSGLAEIHPSTVSTFSPTNLAWDKNFDDDGTPNEIPIPNGQVATEYCNDIPWTLPAGYDLADIVVNLPTGTLGLRTTTPVTPASAGIPQSDGKYTMNKDWDEITDGGYIDFGEASLNVNGHTVLGFKIGVPSNISSKHLIDGSGEIGYFEIYNNGQYTHNSQIRGGRDGTLTCHHYLARGVVGDCQKVGTDTVQVHHDAYVEMDVRPGGATDKHYDGAQVFYNGDCTMDRIVVDWKEAGTISNTTGALFTQHTAALYTRDFLILNPAGTFQLVRLSGTGTHDVDDIQVMGPQGVNNNQATLAPTYCVKITNGSGSFTLTNDCPGSGDFLIE